MSRATSHHGTITNWSAGTTSDSADQFGGQLFYVHIDAGDVLAVIKGDGTSGTLKALVAGWQPEAVKRVLATGTTIADSTVYRMGR